MNTWEKLREKQKNSEKNPLNKIMWILLIISWFITLLIMIFYYYAKPQFNTFFDRMFGISKREVWDTRYSLYLIRIMVAGIIFSSAGILVNYKIHNRFHLKYHLGFFILFFISLIGIIVYAF